MFLDTVDPTRETRMEAILEVLGSRLRPPIRVLEIGTGPGPLAHRILHRFKRSRILGVDSDPVLLRTGERALDGYGNRVSWVLADLRIEGWSVGLPAEGFDAAVSSLALHWLEERELWTVYRDLRPLLRPGGLLVNGDFLPSRRPGSAFRTRGTSSDRRPRADQDGQGVPKFKREWKRWWNALERDPTMHSAFRRRQVWMPGPIPPRRTSGPRVPVTVESHEHGLRAAGFRDTAVVWRDHGFRVLVGTNGIADRKPRVSVVGRR